MTLADKIEGAEAGSRDCRDCLHALGSCCARNFKIPFEQYYERAYTDSDFCGPEGRFFEGVRMRDKLSRFLSAFIRAKAQADG